MIASGQDLTKFNEGCVLTARPDAKGMWAIGWGHDLEPSPGLTWTQEQCDSQFLADYAAAEMAAISDLGEAEWAVLGEERRAVLTDIAFETGQAGLAGFKHMLDAVRATDWAAAAEALRDSLLFKQVPNRENRNIAILLTGVWPQAGA